MSKAGSSRKTRPIEHVAICGGGLAGHMTAAVLSHHLPPGMRITLVGGEDAPDTDLFYGSVTAPSAYAFNLLAGVSEPQLVLESSTIFSFGTEYRGWGGEGRSWIQCFQQPLPAMNGVLFHHYLSRLNIGELEPWLISAVAARDGRFAHPPGEGGTPLSRAEYGYQFDPQSYAKLFATATNHARVERVWSTISDVERDEDGISALRLADGRFLTADLYVDCTGPAAALLGRLGATFSGNRRLRAASSRMSADRIGPPRRTLTAGEFGWQADTPLRGQIDRLTVFDPDAEQAALLTHGGAPMRAAEVTVGRHGSAWSGNCVALGQAAGVVEPLTPASIILLQRDIERLLSLIPVSGEMSVEQREFNRQYMDDYVHAGLFNRALFATHDDRRTSYWCAARGEPMNEKLTRKIDQFESRGLNVTFDFEPFNPEDWIILHYGIGRRPARYDRIADQAPRDKVENYLLEMRRGIMDFINTMPSHDAYMGGLARYLMKKDD